MVLRMPGLKMEGIAKWMDLKLQVLLYMLLYLLLYTACVTMVILDTCQCTIIIAVLF